jgi:FeS assembly SUF system regulator
MMAVIHFMAFSSAVRLRNEHDACHAMTVRRCHVFQGFAVAWWVNLHGDREIRAALSPRWCAAAPLTAAALISTILVPIQPGPVPMLRVSRLTDYATVVMAFIATHPDHVHSAVQIAEETRLELPTVSKLLKTLGHAALVESFRGVNGGYRLARSATEISLAEIVEALEGPLGMTECSIAEGQCDREAQCGVRGSWQQINHVLDTALRAVSLADMMKPPPNRRIAMQVIDSAPVPAGATTTE